MSAGLREFQLYLLKTMAPPDQVLADALTALDSTEREMLDCFEQVSTLIHPQTGTAQNLRAILGAPETSPHGTYELPLWADIDLNVTFLDAHYYNCDMRFTKKPGQPRPTCAVVWRFLAEDLPELYENIEEVDPWGHYITYLADNRADGQRYFLRFGWSLLQEIEPMPGRRN